MDHRTTPPTSTTVHSQTLYFRQIMPSVSEELAALRGRGLAQKEATKLKGAKSLSTPEAIDKDLKDNKVDLKRVDEVKASNATSQETEWYVNQRKMKQADQTKKQEAAAILQGYKVATTSTPVLPNADAPATKKKGGKKADKKVAAKVDKKAPTPAAEKAETNAPAATTEKAEVKAPAVESVEDDVPDLEAMPDLDGVPDLEPAPAGVPEVPGEPKQNRAEKKARKSLLKLGMRPVAGIARATFKMRSGIFAIDKPDVYQSGKSYVVFGEARQQDAGGQMAQAARQFQQPEMQQQAAASLEADDVPDLAPAPEPAAAPVVEESVDETGIDAKDIDLVMSQATCSRSKAVQALKDNDGDLVNAIMALTT